MVTSPRNLQDLTYYYMAKVRQKFQNFRRIVSFSSILKLFFVFFYY